MEHLLNWIDPSLLAGFSVALLLFLCAAVLYTMRDPTPYPHRVAHRLRCPHQSRKFTVEVSPSQPGTVSYCSAFAYGQIRCDQACLAAQRSPAR
jgi:hypothetical protein